MAVAMVLVGACELYEDGPKAGEDAAAAPTVDAGAVTDAAECPTVQAEPCPPWWTSCQPDRLRQAECRVMCSGGATCAGYDVGECFTDCMAFRYEAFCLMP